MYYVVEFQEQMMIMRVDLPGRSSRRLLQYFINLNSAPRLLLWTRLKNRGSHEFTILSIYFFSFRIFEQLALDLKTEFTLKFFKPQGPSPTRTPCHANYIWAMNEGRAAARKSSIGGLCVCLGGGWHWNFDKNSTDLWYFIFQLGAWCFVWGD